MMNHNCCKTVLAVAVIGTIGSLAGWYWEELLRTLTQSLPNVHFGPALLWCVLAAVIVRLLNRLIFKN